MRNFRVELLSSVLTNLPYKIVRLCGSKQETSGFVQYQAALIVLQPFAISQAVLQ